MIRAVIFDLDDTLYDEEQFVLSGFKAVAGALHTRCGLNAEAVYERMRHLLFEKGRGRIFDDVLAENGLDISQAGKLVEIYRGHKPVLQLYSDARLLLQMLRDKVKLGLITDGAAGVQWNKIRALGLEKVMDIIVVTDDYGQDCWKPSYFPYRKVMEELALEGKHLVYIGDNPHKDFATARELGWRTIRVRREKGMFHGIRLDKTREADIEVAALDQIADLRGVQIG